MLQLNEDFLPYVRSECPKCSGFDVGSDSPSARIQVRHIIQTLEPRVLNRLLPYYEHTTGDGPS
jgi:hypothetical protein